MRLLYQFLQYLLNFDPFHLILKWFMLEFIRSIRKPFVSFMVFIHDFFLLVQIQSEISFVLSNGKRSVWLYIPRKRLYIYAGSGKRNKSNL